MIELIILFLGIIVSVGLLIGLLVWVSRMGGDGPRTVNPYVTAPTPRQPLIPTAPPPDEAYPPEPLPARRPQVAPDLPVELSLAHYVAFDRLLAAWAADGRLAPAAAGDVRALLADHVAALFPAPDVAAAPAPVAVTPIGVTPVAVTPVAVTPVAVTPVAVTPVAVAAPAPEPLAPDAPPPAPPAPRRPSAIEAIGAAALALDTRRALLYIGTFLLILSGVTLVVFNWNSLPALVQFAIIAGTTAGIWGGGAWMVRKPDLAVAGRNLQIVAALLMPVVGFALGRPGLLDLEPRPAWQLTSALSLAAYLLASWRTGRGFYSGAAAIAAVSTLLASLGAVDAGWQPAPTLLLLAAILGASRVLRVVATPQLATGPRWVALIGGPLGALGAAALAVAGLVTSGAAAANLAAATIFCGAAYWAEARRPWLWAGLALAPGAVYAALLALDITLEPRTLALGVLALGYLILSEPAATRHRPAAWPLLILGLTMGGLTFLMGLPDSDVARLALPALILMGAAAFGLVEAGTLRWVGEPRIPLATAGLTAAVLLLCNWLVLLLDAAGVSMGAAGLWLLPLGAAAFAGARWWPGERHPSYDIALQTVATLITLGAGGAALSEWGTRIPAAALVALIFGGQAVVRRTWPWAALSLGAAAAAIFLVVQRSTTPAQRLDSFTLTALGVATAYSLGGALLRRGGLRYWTWPAVGWGGLFGAATLSLAALQLGPAEPVAVAAILGLATLLGAHTAIWRRAELGYGAAPLLALAVGAAATRGFFLGWQPAPGDLAYVLCAFVLGLALLGQGLRRFGRAYAWPYELLAFALLPLAPFLAAGRPDHLTLTWGAMALLYGAALWRYRFAWMLAPAFICADMALLHGAGWLSPGGDPANASLLIAGAVWAQALVSAWLRRRPAPWASARPWGYLSAATGGAGALALTLGSSGHGAVVALVLAALLALLAWVERSEESAWGSLALLGLGLGLWHHALGLSVAGSLFAGSLEALLVYVAGWGVTRLGAAQPRLAPWRRPLEYGAAVAAVALPALFALHALVERPELLATALLLLGLATGVAGWRRGLPVLLTPALASWGLAVAAHGELAAPVPWEANGAYLSLALAWAIGLAAIWAGRRRGTALSYPVYGASLLVGGLGLLPAWGSSGELAALAGGLAVLWAVAASVERAEPAAWGAFGLIVVSATLAGDALGLTPAWTAAWLVLAMGGVSAAGWGAKLAGLAIWRRPTAWGALGAAALATPLALLLGGALPPLTFALASLGLLLATLAVRERELYYAYAAGAAFVGAGLCQLADWGVSEPQWYVIPAGLYLVALAAGLRRFQGQRRASQVVETAAIMLLLGVTFGQAVRPEGGLPYSLLLFGESLLMVAYGALGRLRVPFLGGAAFFVAGATWMTVDTVRLTNQWVLLGAVGLLMVAAYVVLERHQERLVRAGRHWAAELRSWG
jgi:hypothetical protein